MNENMAEIYSELDEYLERKSYRQFTDLIDKLNPIDVAEYIEEFSEEKLLTVFRLLKKDIAAEIFTELSSSARETIILATTDRDIAGIVENLFVDDAVDLLEELPASMVKRILRSAKPEKRALINKFLQYPDCSAGSIMTAEYIDLKKTMTVKEAVARIRKTGIKKETVYTVRSGEELTAIPETSDGYTWSTSETVYIVPDFKAILADMICYAIRREQ